MGTPLIKCSFAHSVRGSERWVLLGGLLSSGVDSVCQDPDLHTGSLSTNWRDTESKGHSCLDQDRGHHDQRTLLLYSSVYLP